MIPARRKMRIGALATGSLCAIMFFFGGHYVNAGLINSSFPDVLYCPDTADSAGAQLYLVDLPAPNGNFFYAGGATYSLTFDNTGAQTAQSGLTGYDCVNSTWGISTFISNGDYFNFTIASSSSASSTVATTTTYIVDNPTQDLFDAAIVFFISMFGTLWLFRRFK